MNETQRNNPPTPDQIENSKALGWEYVGDGYFVKGDMMGYFVEKQFFKE